MNDLFARYREKVSEEKKERNKQILAFWWKKLNLTLAEFHHKTAQIKAKVYSRYLKTGYTIYEIGMSVLDIPVGGG